MNCETCEHYKELAQRRLSAMEAAIADLENAEVGLRAERRTVARLKGEISKLQADLVDKDEVEAVFNYWRTALRADSKRVVLGPKRREKITARLREGYGVEDLCKAIDGARIDAFEKNGKRYDDLELILRNEVNVERFMAAYDRHMDRVQEFVEREMPELGPDDDQIPGQTNILDALKEVHG